jgi:hypothetical protein
MYNPCNAILIDKTAMYYLGQQHPTFQIDCLTASPFSHVRNQQCIKTVGGNYLAIVHATRVRGLALETRFDERI